MGNSSTSRLLIYAHYDPKGELDPHVKYQLKTLKNFGCDIIFVSNSPLGRLAKIFLANCTVKVIERPDIGWDWTAWKDALLGLPYQDVSVYDELILMNDSTYGPLFPLEEMFGVMDKLSVDYWGITRGNWRATLEHIQPYFCVFRPQLFLSKCFWNFWQGLPVITTYEEARDYGELQMTKIFDEAGFTHAAYADLPEIPFAPAIGPDEPLVYTVAPWLILKYRSPFIKIKAFRTADGKQFNAGREVFESLEEAGSTYPIGLITRHLARTRPLSWSKNQPGFLNAFPTSASIPPDPKLKLAVFAHLHYEEQFEEAVNILKRIPYVYDLYISTTGKDKAKTLYTMVKKTDQHVTIDKLEIRVFNNRGRDVAPWLLGFKDIQYDYDLALKFHLKNRISYNEIYLNELTSFILNCTIASPSYVGNIVNMFNRNPKLGIAFHPYPPCLLLQYHHRLTGDNNTFKATRNALKKCNINYFNENRQIIFPQNIFWYRPQSLKKLFESNITYEDFPPEPYPLDATIGHGLERAIPYIVQDSGYAVSLVITDDLLQNTFQHYEDHILNCDHSHCYYARISSNILF